MGREGWEDVWTGKKRERMRGMNVKKRWECKNRKDGKESCRGDGENRV